MQTRKKYIYSGIAVFVLMLAVIVFGNVEFFKGMLTGKTVISTSLTDEEYVAWLEGLDLDELQAAAQSKFSDAEDALDSSKDALLSARNAVNAGSEEDLVSAQEDTSAAVEEGKTAVDRLQMCADRAAVLVADYADAQTEYAALGAAYSDASDLASTVCEDADRASADNPYYDTYGSYLCGTDEVGICDDYGSSYSDYYDYAYICGHDDIEMRITIDDIYDIASCNCITTDPEDGDFWYTAAFESSINYPCGYLFTGLMDSFDDCREAYYVAEVSLDQVDSYKTRVIDLLVDPSGVASEIDVYVTSAGDYFDQIKSNAIEAGGFSIGDEISIDGGNLLDGGSPIVVIPVVEDENPPADEAPVVVIIPVVEDENPPVDTGSADSSSGTSSDDGLTDNAPDDTSDSTSSDGGITYNASDTSSSGDAEPDTSVVADNSDTSSDTSGGTSSADSSSSSSNNTGSSSATYGGGAGSSGGGGSSSSSSSSSSSDDSDDDEVVSSLADTNTDTSDDGCSHPFIDIYGHWAEGKICDLFSDSIVKGRTSDKFVPNDNIKIAEYIKILVLSAGFQVEDAEGLTEDYTDADSSDWYYPYIVIAQDQGVIRPVEGDLNFDKPITRWFGVLLLTRMSGKTLWGWDSSDIIFSDVFADDYFAYAVIIANEGGVIEGYTDGTFRPDANMTRAEAAKVISAARSSAWFEE